MTDLKKRLEDSCPVLRPETIEAFLAFSEGFKTNAQRNYYASLLGGHRIGGLGVEGVCNFCGCDFKDLTQEGVNAWCEMRRNELPSPKSFSTCMASIRSLSKQLDMRLGTDINYLFNSNLSNRPQTWTMESEDLLSIKDVDDLLKAIQKDRMLTAAVVLAFRCAIGITDLAELRKGMFFRDKKGRAGLKPTSRAQGYILIPEDVAVVIDKYLETLPDNSWLFPSNRGGRHVSPRRLRGWLSEAVKEHKLSDAITFRRLRDLSIVSMLHGGASAESVANYASSTTDNMAYYNRVIPELDDAAVNYSRIRILQEA